MKGKNILGDHHRWNGHPKGHGDPSWFRGPTVQAKGTPVFNCRVRFRFGRQFFAPDRWIFEIVPILYDFVDFRWTRENGSVRMRLLRLSLSSLRGKRLFIQL